MDPLTLFITPPGTTADILNKETTTVLQMVAARSSYKVVDTLLRNRVDVNAMGHPKTGATALQFALLRQFDKLSNLLVAYSADVNAPPCSYQGGTCLQIVASIGNLD